MTAPEISVIVPIRNERAFIAGCIKSIYDQDFPKEKIEVLAVDGRSTDGTLEILKGLQKEFANLVILDNPDKVVTSAINIGVQQSKGRYIARMDAHAVYGQDYLKNCLEVIEATKADNVGGPALPLTKSKTAMAQAIVLAHLSPFGLGGGAFRNPNAEGFVETVWPGFYRREVFEKVGYLTFSIPRSEDIEFNTRAVEAGFKIYLSPKIKSYYYCRDTLKKIWIQRWGDGISIARTLKINPKAPRLRHFIPLVFVTSLILLTALAVFLPTELSPVQKIAVCCRSAVGLKTPVWPYVFKLSIWNLKLAAIRLLLLELLAYFAAMLLAVIKAAKPEDKKLRRLEDQKVSEAQKAGEGDLNFPTSHPLSVSATPGSLALLPVVFLTLHFSYGLGSIWGLITLPLWLLPAKHAKNR